MEKGAALIVALVVVAAGPGAAQQKSQTDNPVVYTILKAPGRSVPALSILIRTVPALGWHAVLTQGQRRRLPASSTRRIESWIHYPSPTHLRRQQ
jgi:hypothetical protein